MINKLFLVLILIILIVTEALSLICNVPYIYTLIGFSIWSIVGQMVTSDDELPGGWCNIDGKTPYPWRELFIKLVLLGTLVSIVIFFPQVKSFGR